MKKILILVVLLEFVYAGLFPARFMTVFIPRFALFKDVFYIFVLASAAYLVSWVFFERNSSKSSVVIQDTKSDPGKPVAVAEEWILDKLNSPSTVLHNHGVTLLEHSLAVAGKIAEKDPSRVARLAALAHDLGKVMVKNGNYSYHDKLSAMMLRGVKFEDLTEEEYETLVMAVKYHHDDYVPELNDHVRSLLENLKYADMAITGIEKTSLRFSQDDINQMIIHAFHSYMSSVPVNNTEAVSVIYSSDILAVREISLTEGVLNCLPEDFAIAIGASVKRAPRKLHPAFLKIRDALGDIIIYDYKGIRTNNGLYNLKSSKKFIHAVVLIDREKLPYADSFHKAKEWPYKLMVLPWQE